MPELIIEYFQNRTVDSRLLLNRYIFDRHVCSVFSDCESRYIVPTSRKARQIRSIIAESCGGALVGGMVITLENLIDHVAAAAVSEPLLNGTKGAVLIEDVLLHGGSELQMLGGRPGFTGYVTKIAALISELKQNDVPDAGTLRKLCAAHRLNASPVVVEDFMRVFEAYTARSSSGGEGDGRVLLDREDVIARCTEYIAREGLESVLPGVGLFVWDGFYDFNPLQKKFVAALIGNAERTVFALATAGPEEGEKKRMKKVFVLPDNTARFLSKLDVAITENYNSNPGVKVMRPAAHENMFVSVIDKREGVPAGVGIKLIKARNREDEVKRIAAAIKKDLVEGVAAPEDVSVVFPSLESYMPMIRQWFPRYGIAFSEAAGDSLGASPVAGAFLSIIDVVESGFARTAVYKMAASTFFSFDNISGDSRFVFSASRMDTVARDAMVTGGKLNGGEKDWLRKFERRRAWLVKEVHRNERDCDDEKHEAERAQRRVDELDFYRAVFERMVDLLRPFTRKTVSLDDYFDGIADTLALLDFEKNIYLGGPPDLNESAKAANAAALAALYDALDDCRSALSLVADEECATVSALNSYVKVAVRGGRYMRPGCGGGVDVMGLYETRGLEIGKLYMGGLIDGEFPACAGRPFIFKNEDRKKIGLKSIMADPSEDRLIFYSLISSVHAIVLSYPLWDGESECVRSDFMNELELVTAIEEIGEPPPEKPFTLLQWQTIVSETTSNENDSVRAETAAMMRTPQAAIRADYFRAMLRGCLVEHQRGADTLGSFDGQVNDAGLLKELRERFISSGKPFSSTRLETYARCPFKFFCSRYVLDLAAPEEVEEEISPATTGSLVHEILQKFYENRLDPETHIAVRVTPDNFDDARQQLLDIAEKLLAKMPFKGFFWDRYKEQLLAGLSDENAVVEKIACADGDIEIVRPPGLLLKFLRRESELPAGLQPAYFETEFPCGGAEGGNDAPCAGMRVPAGWTCEVEGGKVCFSGFVDRIDIAEIDGGGRGWMVIDYKTGAPRNIKLTLEGLDFQLPLYMLLTSSMLSPHDELIGAAYDSLKPGHEGRNVFIANENFVSKKYDDGAFIVTNKKSGILSDEAFREELANAESRIEAVVRAIVSGHFQTTFESPPVAGCSYCEFSRICRLDTVRMEFALKKSCTDAVSATMYIRDPLREEAVNGVD